MVAAPDDEFVGAEFVGLDLAAPCEVEAFGAVFDGADAVLPVVGCCEVPARVAEDGDVEGLEG